MRWKITAVAGLRALLTTAPAMMLLLGACQGYADELGDCGHPVPGRSIPACSALIERGGASSDRLTDWLLLRGISHLINGDSDRAIADLDEVIRKSPNNAAAYVARGDAYRGKGQDEKGIADYDAAMRVDPNHYEARLARREADREAGRVDADPATFTKELEELGWERMWRRVPFRSLSMHKRLTEHTFAELDEAVRRNPSDPGAYMKRGKAFTGHGERQFARAMADYNRALGADPGYIEAYIARAELHNKQGNWGLAITDADHALRLRQSADRDLARPQASFVAIYMVRGTAYREKGDYVRAIGDFDQAILSARKDRLLYLYHGWLYYGRGLAHERSGDREKAIDDYLEVFKVGPSPSRFAVPAAEQALKRLGATDRGGLREGWIAYLDLKIAERPMDEKNYRLRCEAYGARGEYDRAIRDCDQAVLLAPGFFANYSSRGRLRSAKGDLDAALADFDQVVRLHPKGPEGYADRGLAYEKKGDREKAIADYRRAIAVLESNVEDHKRWDPAFASRAPGLRSPAFDRSIEGLKRLGETP